jgi:hypothetical protein
VFRNLGRPTVTSPAFLSGRSFLLLIALGERVAQLSPGDRQIFRQYTRFGDYARRFPFWHLGLRQRRNRNG